MRGLEINGRKTLNESNRHFSARVSNFPNGSTIGPRISNLLTRIRSTIHELDRDRARNAYTVDNATFRIPLSPLPPPRIRLFDPLQTRFSLDLPPPFTRALFLQNSSDSEIVTLGVQASRHLVFSIRLGS